MYLYFYEFISLAPQLSPSLPGITVLTTRETAFNQTLCVSDIATIIKHGESKTLCVDVAKYVQTEFLLCSRSYR